MGVKDRPADFPLFPIAICDTCVLLLPIVRDILIGLGEAGMFYPRWSNDIYAEWRSIPSKNKSFTPEKLAYLDKRTIRSYWLMNRYIPKGLVSGYRKHIRQLQLRDPKDRHVLAAGLEADAQFIITSNLRDFRQGEPDVLLIPPIHPDAFILGIADGFPNEVVDVLHEHRERLKKPPLSPQEYLEKLHRNGLSETVEFFKPYAWDRTPEEYDLEEYECANQKTDEDIAPK